jgi:uncharacterized protein (DUF488 family)
MDWTGTTLWTVGHSTLPLEALLDVLQSAGIVQIADVRRFPGSRRHPQFGREALEAGLARHQIGYLWFPELGGRRTGRGDSPHTALRNAAFRAYADHMETDEFREALERLRQLAAERRTSIMCAEAPWFRCHRMLLADAVTALGGRVLHLAGRAAPREHRLTQGARVADGRVIYDEGQPSLTLSHIDERGE